MTDRTQSPRFKNIEKISIPKIYEFKTDCGTKVFFVQEKNAGLTKILWNFDAGSWKQDKLLTATTTNKLMAEGTNKHNATEISEILDFYGAKLKKRTGYHFAAFDLMTIAKYEEQLIGLIYEILSRPTFPQKELDIYIKKNKHDLKLELEKVDILARNLFMQTIFGEKHPYGVFALPEDYDKIERQKIIEFYNKFYKNENHFIVVIGSNIDKTLKFLNKNCKLLASESTTKDTPKTINPGGQKNIYQKKSNAVQTALRIGKPLFNKLHPDFYDINFTTVLLGGYFGSRLMRSIREEKGLTYGIYSVLYSLKYEGFFSIETEVKKELKDKATEAILDEIKKLSTVPPSTEEVEKVKNYMLGRLLMSFDNTFYMCNYIMDKMIYDLNFDFINNIIDKIKNITPKKVTETVNKYLRPEDLYIVAVG